MYGFRTHSITKQRSNEVTSHLSNDTSLRKIVFDELDKNPLLTAKSLANQLHYTKNEYEYHKGYLKKLKYEWKHHHKNERGSIRSVPDGVHNAFFVGCLGGGLCDRVRLDLKDVFGRVGVGGWAFCSGFGRQDGWKPSKSKNRFFLFKSPVLGRIRFFENGNLELYVRKPASVGKAMQLFCDAFTKTQLVTDLLDIEAFQKTLRIRRFHATFDTDQRLPYMKVPIFKGTNGFELILGDRTHPHSAELIVEYQEQVESAKRLFEQLSELFGLGKSGDVRSKGLAEDYSR